MLALEAEGPSSMQMATKYLCFGIHWTAREGEMYSVNLDLPERMKQF